MLIFHHTYLYFKVFQWTYFSHTNLSFSLLYLSSRDHLLWEYFWWSREVDHQVFHPLLLGICRGAALANYCACACRSYRNKWGTCESRVLEGALCKCCGIEWSCRILLVKILNSVEGGDIKQVCSSLETNLPCLRLLISHSLTCVYISFMLLLFIYIC